MKGINSLPGQDKPDLSASIRASTGSDNSVETILRTSERVIARVTDGIYRQPSSAIRELISNAYDADAKRVVVHTDAPRFERIVVEDDGHGMAPEALAYLIQNIGGSAKRRGEGSGLGMTSSSDPSLSPGGRKLIGKIGIGLFSVAQLTNTFQIITKTKGDGFRTVASIVMRQYSDEPGKAGDDQGEFESGKVRIWREVALDTESQGTTIVLSNIRRQARDTLRSDDIWSVIEQNESALEDEKVELDPPKYHIGRTDRSGEMLRSVEGETSALPWGLTDRPDERFRKLVSCVWREVSEGNSNPKLETLFDYYLRMVWQLSLAIPLPYVAGHLFDEPASDWTRSFLLSNSPKGKAIEAEDAGESSIRELFGLRSGDTEDFGVVFDGIELSHPLQYRDLPTTSSALKQPLVFVGKVSEPFSKVPFELSGGPLEFEAYLFWSPKIAPVEHQGVLVRINGASGTLFDPTFMRYQVQEIQRLKQVTCEIFVKSGLDSALNIDRESFNVAHPHAVYITKWVHSALRQLATAQKRVAAEVRGGVREVRERESHSRVQAIADRVWDKKNVGRVTEPPVIRLSDGFTHGEDGKADYVFSRAAVLSPVLDEAFAPKSTIAKSTIESRLAEEKVRAIAQVLAAFDLLDVLSKPQQEELLRAIYQIVESGGN
ncbi:TPA: ATP-binding protein [Stenotrophomonas maltophilia]